MAGAALTGNVLLNGQILPSYTTALNSYTYATLPSPTTGMVVMLTDSPTVIWGGVITIGSSVGSNVMARYNGTNWTVVGI